VREDGRSRAELLAELDELRRQLAELRAAATPPARAAEADGTAEDATYRELVHSANSIVLRWDLRGRVTYLNPYGEELFGYRNDEIVGRSVVGTIVPETETSGRDLVRMIDDILQHPERYQSNENENVCRNGERVWITWRNRPIVDSSGRLREILSIGIDTTERKRAEEALRASEESFRYLSVHDNLTGLYNRRYLFEALGRLIDSCSAPRDCLSVLFLDIDHFKHVVDTRGHLNGSRVIQELAATVQECISDPAFAVAYAGDEFVVVLPGHSKAQAVDQAERIRSGIAERVFLPDHDRVVRLTASFGVATFPQDAKALEPLLAWADQALFTAKAAGGNAVEAG
jgi:diguanylate cyclase (GGDEF)-like protein/PAS domain S-box-containing protein